LSSGIGGQTTGQGVQFAGIVFILAAQVGLEQVGVATGVVIDAGVGLQGVDQLKSLRLAVQLEQHVGRTQACFDPVLVAGDTLIPVQRVLEALEVFGDLAQQQAPGRILAGRTGRLDLVVEPGQGGAVVGLGQQRGAQAVAAGVLRTLGQHLGSLYRQAQRVELGGRAQAHVGIGGSLPLQAFQHLAGLLGLAGLAQLAGVQQRHARIDREALDDLADDALGQRRLVQRLARPPNASHTLRSLGSALSSSSWPSSLAERAGSRPPLPSAISA